MVNKQKVLKILGLITIISYLIVILVTWISANIAGYIYFSAGEPNLLIKYTEWTLGILGIFVMLNILKDEVCGEKNVGK